VRDHIVFSIYDKTFEKCTEEAQNKRDLKG